MEFFTADTHFGHGNIIRHCSRPFIDALEMDDAMLRKLNAKVSPEDTLRHIGDFSWTDPIPILKRIACRNIHLIIGNHDKKRAKQLETACKMGLLSTVTPYGRYVDTQFYGQKVTLCHMPMRSWNIKAHGAWHLYGHVHGTIKDPDFNSMDVGVDAHDFEPVSWTEVVEYMSRFTR